MDEKPKCSQDVEPITLQTTTKKENPEEQKEQLVLSKKQSPTTRDQSGYSEDHSDAAKTLTVILKDRTDLTTEQSIFSTGHSLIILSEQLCDSTDQPLFSKDKSIHQIDGLTKSKEQLVFSKEEPTYSKQHSPYLKSQTVLMKNQPILSIEQSPFISDLPDGAEGQLEPDTKNVLAKDQSIFSADQPIHVREQPEFSNEQPQSSEAQSTVSETQNVLAKEQSISSAVQPILVSEPPKLCNDQPRSSEEQSAVLETQTVLTIEKPTDQPIFSIEQPGCSKDQPFYVTDQPISLQSFHSINLPKFTLDQPTCSKHQPAAYSKNESAFSRKSLSTEEQTGLTINYIDPTVHETSSSREFYISPKIFEAASTKYVSVFLKNEVAKLLGKTINVEYGVNLCAPRGASANCMNNGYFVSANNPLKINTATQSPSFPISLLPAPASAAVAAGNQPASLFLQALSKLNENSLTLAVISHFGLQSPSNLSRTYTFLSGDITPPDSLTSAPPTYSFVLRQIAGRRRPRFMSSFFPSPSFVQRTPPPTYTGAFDVYVEPALPPPPMRTYSLGYNSMPVICPECGYTGMTVIRARVTVCTHCCAFVLCILCCWICAPLPYLLTSCKDVYHYCRNCRSFLGMYCPSNPEATSIFPTDLNR